MKLITHSQFLGWTDSDRDGLSHFHSQPSQQQYQSKQKLSDVMTEALRCPTPCPVRSTGEYSNLFRRIQIKDVLKELFAE